MNLFYSLRGHCVTGVYLLLLSGAANTAASERVVIGAIGSYGAAVEGPIVASQVRAVADLVKSWDPDFIITLGGNNFPAGEASTIDTNIGQFYHEYIYSYIGSYGSGALSNRFLPALGWRDYGLSSGSTNPQAYLDYFSLPGNERYYSFRQGPVELFALNPIFSNEPDGYTSDSVQGQWLQSRLAASSATWRLVYFHEPPYSSGEYSPGASFLRWPFAEWGATAVLAGHDRIYERIHTNDIIYFNNGLGGDNIYQFRTNLPGSQVRFNQDYGAMRIVVTDTNLVFQFITRSNVLVDTWVLNVPAEGPPYILRPPKDQTVLTARTASFYVIAGGAEDLRYQWQFNSTNIPDATNRTLTITSAQFSNEGEYSVIVSDPTRSTRSRPARLSVLRHPLITEHPAAQKIKATSNVTFQVQAEGYGPFSYAWFFNGEAIPAATGSSLTLTNVQFSQSGDYSVAVTDDVGSIMSNPARLTVVAAPIFAQQPLSQSAVVGQTVVFSVSAIGTLPITNNWRLNFFTVTNIVRDDGTCFFTIPNVQTNHAGTYRVRLFNEGGSALNSSNAVLVVLEDRDQDGMADNWELAYGLDPDDPDDGQDDADGDNFSNRDEHLAGTDPLATNSVLWIQQIIPVSSNEFQLQFTAFSNKTYAVEFGDEPQGSNWNRLAEFAAASTNRLLQAIDTTVPNSTPQRVYRLVTPRLPWW